MRVRPAWLLLLRISLAEAGKGRPRRVSKSHAARMPKRLHQPSRTPVSGKAAAARHQGVCVTRVGMACSRLTGLSGSVRDLLAVKARSDGAGAKVPARLRARARARARVRVRARVSGPSGEGWARAQCATRG